MRPSRRARSTRARWPCCASCADNVGISIPSRPRSPHRPRSPRRPPPRRPGQPCRHPCRTCRGRGRTRRRHPPVPPGAPVRRHRPLRLTAVALASVAVTGCGGGGSPGAPETSAGDVGFHGCRPADLAGRGTVVARADLDGRRGPETVRLTGRSGPCHDSLVTLLAGRVAGVDVHGMDLAAKPATVVHLRGAGAPDLVLVSSRPHPRGGTQPHLFAADAGDPGRPGRLVEVTAGGGAGGPALPFLATDGGGAPVGATCTPDGGIAVDTATAHQPPGIVVAWDVTRTTYAIDDGLARRTGSSLVADAAADPALRRDRPDLFSGDLFADCS